MNYIILCCLVCQICVNVVVTGWSKSFDHFIQPFWRNYDSIFCTFWDMMRLAVKSCKVAILLLMLINAAKCYWCHRKRNSDADQWRILCSITTSFNDGGVRNRSINSFNGVSWVSTLTTAWQPAHSGVIARSGDNPADRLKLCCE